MSVAYIVIGSRWWHVYVLLWTHVSTDVRETLAGVETWKSMCEGYFAKPQVFGNDKIRARKPATVGRKRGLGVVQERNKPRARALFSLRKRKKKRNRSSKLADRDPCGINQGLLCYPKCQYLSWKQCAVFILVKACDLFNVSNFSASCFPSKRSADELHNSLFSVLNWGVNLLYYCSCGKWKLRRIIES